MKKDKLFKFTVTAVMAALSYVVFTFLQIKIPMPGQDATSIHLGNAVCVLAALLLGGTYGGLAGAVGMTIGDLFDPIYIIYAPKTFVLKFLIGLIVGFFAHALGKITHSKSEKHVFWWTVCASSAGMLFNFIFDPLVGYFYKILIVGKPAAEVALVWNVAASGINAVLSVIVAVLLYVPIRKALKKADLFMKIGREKKNEEKSTSDK